MTEPRGCQHCERERSVSSTCPACRVAGLDDVAVGRIVAGVADVDRAVRAYREAVAQYAVDDLSDDQNGFDLKADPPTEGEAA